MAGLVSALDVLEVRTTICNHLEESAAGVVVFLVRLEMLCKLVDACGKNTDLSMGRTRVFVVDLGLFDDSLFLFGIQHNFEIVAYI